MQKQDNTGHSPVDTILTSYLNGETTPDLDVKIQEWIVNGQDMSEKVRVLKRLWEQRVRESNPDRAAYEALADIRRRLGFEQVTVKPRLHKLRRVLAPAAAVLVIGFVAGGVWLLASQMGKTTQTSQIALAEPVSEQTAEQITVNAGEMGRVEVMLPDGSQVWVHRKGSITYSKDFVDDRIVHLTGEAYFSVVKQEGEEFIVKSDDISVRVLGTEFLVRAGDDATQSYVEVASGMVEVSMDDELHILGADESFLYEEQTGETSMEDITPGDVVAPWKNVELVFENSSLDTIFQNIATFYGVNIAIDDSLPMNDRLTVSFAEDESLEEVLYVIGKTSGSFDFEIDKNNVTIVRH